MYKSILLSCLLVATGIVATGIVATGIVGCGDADSTEGRKRLPIVRKRVTWLHDYETAVKKSQDVGKPIFAFFTGSDWCKYCELLDDQILNTEVFANWSKEHVVLLEIDFPRNKELPPPLRKQNEDLKNKYRISGFPTILFLTPEGAPILQAGYHNVTAEQWVDVVDKKLKESIASRKTAETENPN